MRFHELSFTWVGNITHKFRAVTEKEKQEYIQTCLRIIQYPMLPNEGYYVLWNIDERHEMIRNLHKGNLIDGTTSEKLHNYVDDLTQKSIEERKQMAVTFFSGTVIVK